MLVTLFGIVTFTNASHPKNASDAICVTPSEITTFVIEEDGKYDVNLDMLQTHSGIVTSVNP